MIFSGRNLVKYPYSCCGYTRGGGKTWHGGIDVCGMADDKLRLPGYNGKKTMYEGTEYTMMQQPFGAHASQAPTEYLVANI